MESLNDHDFMFIERFLLSFKELGGSSDGFIDHNVFQTLLTQEGYSPNEILALLNEEKCVRDNDLNYYQLCASLLVTKTAFNNLSSENGRIGDLNIPINTQTYTRKKSSFQASTRNGSAEENSNTKVLKHQMRGSVFNVSQDILSNQYHMEVLENSYIEIYIKPERRTGLFESVPTEILILQDKDKILTSSFFNHLEGCSVVKHHFKKGKYVLVPLCLIWPEERFKSVNLSSLIDTNDKGQIVLTDACERALRIVFDTIDLDHNGLLSQLEFDLFIQHTSDETAANEWSTIEDNFSVEDHQLTFDGFVELYKMVLQTDPADVTHMLQLMGMNEALEQQNAQPFTLFIESETSQLLLSPLPIAPYKSTAERGLCKTVIEQGFSKKVKNMNDLFIYTLQLPHLVIVVIQNFSHCKVKVRLNCSGSINYHSHRNTLDYCVQVMPKTSALGHYLVPVHSPENCSFQCLDELL